MKQFEFKILTLTLIMGVLVFGGCSVNRGLIVTGESLQVVGNQFVAIAGAYKQGCDVAKSIPPSQCLKFKEFGIYFQKVYPLTVQLWETARVANDASLQGKASDVIQSLSTNLSAIAAEGLGTFGGL